MRETIAAVCNCRLSLCILLRRPEEEEMREVGDFIGRKTLTLVSVMGRGCRSSPTSPLGLKPERPSQRLGRALYEKPTTLSAWPFCLLLSRGFYGKNFRI